jgi:hypothetical protein
MNLLKFIVLVILSFFLLETCSDNPINTLKENKPPKIIELITNPDSISMGQKARIFCNANDPDNDELEYIWISEYGSFSGSGNSITWTAPDTAGIYFIICKINDGNGGTAEDTVSVVVKDNLPPIIISLTANPDTLFIGQQSIINCIAEDPNNDELDYNWISDFGVISGFGNSVIWTAPCIEGQIFIYCDVEDGKAGTARDSVAVYLVNEPPSGLPSHYLVVPTCLYPTIQSAIDFANDGDSIIVQLGTYYENIDMKGKNVFLSSLYILDQEEFYISETIIDGQQSWSVIVINKGENEKCVINGFTLVNGIGAEHFILGRTGGGIYCWHSTPTFKNLIISNNRPGAIFFSQASAILENVVISNNTSGYGNVFIYDCSPSFTNVIITENNGSGLYLSDCRDVTIENLVITNNTSVGIDVGSGSYRVTLKNILVTGNHYSGFAGGGMNIVNSTCVNNGKGLSCSGWATVKNSIFFNNAEKEIKITQMMSGFSGINVQYSNIRGGPDCFEIRGNPDYISIDYDSTNFSTDPQFCDPEFGDYHLKSTSPCVNGGENGGIIGAFGVGCD